MAVKTISFPKGKGHLTHNNRDFISKNVVPERTSWNRIYMQESLEQAYDKCFGQALQDYNAAQKRKDRRKDNYLKEIENSGNKEKTFYENIVQIGKKEDTPVVDENGNLTEEAKLAIEILEQYAKTFQERNRTCICSTALCIWMKQHHICTLIIFRWRMDIKQAWKHATVLPRHYSRWDLQRQSAKKKMKRLHGNKESDPI